MPSVAVEDTPFTGAVSSIWQTSFYFISQEDNPSHRYTLFLPFQCAGNIKFRALVEKHRGRYHAASRVEKGKVVAEVVQLWRQMTPPGRFLTLTEPKLGDASAWHDIGDKLAQKKTAKRLRESLPEATAARNATTAATVSSSDDDSSVEAPRQKRAIRRVSNESMVRAAKRVRLEWNEQTQGEESSLMDLFSFAGDQLSDISDDSPSEESESSNIEEGLNLDSLFSEIAPINVVNAEKVDAKLYNEATWVSIPSASSSLLNTRFGGSLLKEIAISIPSAACLTEVSLFD